MSEAAHLWEHIRESDPGDPSVSRQLEEFAKHPEAADLVAVGLEPSRRRKTLLALQDPGARELIMQLLPKLTRLASVQIAEVTLVREVLRQVPSQSLEGPIWAISEEILDEEDQEAPRRLAELFSELGLRDAINRLLARVVVSNVRDWYEVAHDFAGIWNTEHWGKPVSEWFTPDSGDTGMRPPTPPSPAHDRTAPEGSDPA